MKEKVIKNELSNKETPLISVIVPVYNAERYIHRCLDSIINQTYKNLEIILVDDGSPDNCGTICDEYASQDKRIKVIHQKNGGPGVARNTGLDACTGEYIAFVDSDDYIELEMYEKMLSTILEQKVDICVCQWQYEYADGRQVINIENINPEIYGKKLAVEFAHFFYKGSYENGTVVSPCNKIYSSKVFNAIRFDAPFYEDDALHSVVFSQNYSVFVIPNQFYVYAQNKDSISNRPFRKETIRFLSMLEDRIRLFQNDEFVFRESQKLYCNIYIEYYYKSKKANIEMPDKKVFNDCLNMLRKKKYCTTKFFLRMYLFNLSPRLYEKLLLG